MEATDAVRFRLRRARPAKPLEEEPNLVTCCGYPMQPAERDGAGILEQVLLVCRECRDGLLVTSCGCLHCRAGEPGECFFAYHGITIPTGLDDFEGGGDG